MGFKSTNHHHNARRRGHEARASVVVGPAVAIAGMGGVNHVSSRAIHVRSHLLPDSTSFKHSRTSKVPLRCLPCSPILEVRSSVLVSPCFVPKVVLLPGHAQSLLQEVRG